MYFRDFGTSKREEEIASYRWGAGGQIRKQTYLEKQREDLANLVKKKPLTSHLLNDVSSRLANADEKFTPYRERDFCPYALRPLVDIRAAERKKKARHPPPFRVATLSAHEKLRFLQEALDLEVGNEEGEEVEEGEEEREREEKIERKEKEEKRQEQNIEAVEESNPLFRNIVSPQVAQLRNEVIKFRSVEKITEPVFARKILLQEGKCAEKKRKDKNLGGATTLDSVLEIETSDLKTSESEGKGKGSRARSARSKRRRRMGGRMRRPMVSPSQSG